MKEVADVQKYIFSTFLRSAYWIIIFPLTFITIMPIINISPDQYIYSILLILSSLSVVYGISIKSSWELRKNILLYLIAGSLLCVATGLVYKSLPTYDVFEIPILNFVGPLLHLDGEYAYDAAEFEARIEIWLVLAASSFLILCLIRRWRRL